MEVQPTFRSMEHQGWSERAAAYDAYTGRLTRCGVAPLVEAADIRPGLTVLDVCCGTGLAAEPAARRGAKVTGLDFSEEMIAMAAAKGLPAEFQTGDAENLPFPDASFDRVISNFGYLHLADPDRAMAEAARVLKRGGRHAFTVWRGPDVSPLFRIIGEAVEAHGSPDVGLPPAPPLFRFADPQESARAMHAVGFTGTVAGEVDGVLECPWEAVIDFLGQATVRATMLLRAQRPEVRARIERTIQEELSAYSDGVTLRLPMPALVVSGTRL